MKDLIIGAFGSLLIISMCGCRVQVPKKKAHILTPIGFVHKHRLTTEEKKMLKQWRRLEVKKFNCIER